MENTHRRPSLFWPLLLIGLGVMLLLQNFNLLPPNLWPALVELWPVLLVLLGLDMLIGRRSVLGSAIVVLAGVLLAAGALVWASLRAQSLPPGGTQLVGQDVRGADSARVKIEFGVGALRLSALGPSDHLMEGQVKHGPGESVYQTYEVDDGVGELVLAQRRPALFAPFLAARSADTRWDLQLSARLPLELEIDTGVGEAALDLSGLELTALDLSTGVGRTEVVFPSGALQASLNAGVGEVVVTLPADLPARITVTSGLTGLNIADHFRREGKVYTTPGFTPTGDYLELKLEAGIGQVTIR